MNNKKKSVVLLDFASEMNRGDAVMQEAFIEMLRAYFPNHEQRVVCVYGENQQAAFPRHFDCSIKAGAEIIPGVRKSYNFLGDGSSDVSHRKLRNIFNLLMAYLGVLVFAITRLDALLSANTRRFLGVIRSGDLIVWNGRNFRDRKGIGELYDLLAMVLHPIYCHLLGKKTYAIGVSVWPQQFSISKWILKRVLGRCTVVTARETFSHEYAQRDLGLNNVKLKPDLSFFYIKNNQPAEEKKISGRVAVTLTDWTEDGMLVRENYIQAMQQIMHHFLCKGYTIDIVPQVYYEWESYNDLIDRILDSIPNRAAVNIIRRNMGPDELIEHYRHSDFLVATRMHSAIFALSQLTKIIAIPYDAGAKWHILTDLGLSNEYLINYQDITGDILIEKFDRALVDEEFFSRIEINLPMHYGKVDENITILR